MLLPAGLRAGPADTTKPWTRWWWPGSAVDPAGITAALEAIAAAGLGGVEVTPIYGAQGADARYLPFLSPEYLKALDFAQSEAHRLGLGLDMATGTGWPFGGPGVPPADGSKRIVWQHGKLTGEPTGMMVKRAAPGGAGLVLDPYSPAALRRYLAPFSRGFAQLEAGRPRAQFHDSFEYYGASWTDQLPAIFRQLHGYELADHGPELLASGGTDADSLGRLKDDYRTALAALHLQYLATWADWAHREGSLVRNQSHGAPGNLLDLYGAVDIPETETFGSTPFPIPGLRRDLADIAANQDLPEPLVMRFAASAAHVTGHPLVSSESCTWLRNHWKVSLAMVKPELDRLFLNGINHIFYHGTVYSPPDVAWPGWLFYASTEFNPSNPWWRDFGALNGYVQRVQTLLQAGRPDNEILIYWPVHDVWDDSEGLIKQLGVHDTSWATDSAFGRLAARLREEGYGFDYISDAQLELIQTQAQGGGLVAPGATYPVLIIPATRRMPLATLERLIALGEGGARVHWEALPQDVPGLGRLATRRAQFSGLIQRLHDSLGQSAGRVTVDGDPLGSLPVHPDKLVRQGLEIIRRATPNGHAAFIANLGAERFDAWAGLGVAAESGTLTDPLTGRTGRAAVRAADGGSEVYLQLDPGQTILLHLESPGSAEAWPYLESAGAAQALRGTWQVNFLSGGPELPAPFVTSKLGSWTDRDEPEVKRFAGTARYALDFDFDPSTATDWMLDLGDVRESARVRLNGHELGTAWSLPMRMALPRGILVQGMNHLELEVTNLAANRIRDLDRRSVAWKIMNEINFVDIRYQPFDASTWPLQPSGLLGPVTLEPMAAKTR